MTKQEVIQAFKLGPKEIRETLLSYYRSVNFYKRPDPYQATSQPEIIKLDEEIFAA